VKRLRRAAVVPLALLLAAAAGFGAAVTFKPFHTVVALRKLALRLGGVNRVKYGHLAGWERDRCAAGAPCRCVALVHGMGDSALTWDKVLLGKDATPPPPGTRVLAVELPGTDGSDPAEGPGGYSVPAQARALREVLEPLCPRWTVAGNSLGGWISAELALQWPAGVERLLLLNSAGLTDPTGLLYQTGRILSDPSVAALKDFSGRAAAHRRAVPERAWQEVVDSMRARPIKETFGAFKLEDALDRRAAGIRAPTAVIWGMSDRVMPPSFGERMAKLVPGATLERVPDCGHLPQQECPAPVSRALFGL
jgi:pimeloyl-ACP methyl ester carboxylesterase